MNNCQRFVWHFIYQKSCWSRRPADSPQQHFGFCRRFFFHFVFSHDIPCTAKQRRSVWVCAMDTNGSGLRSLATQCGVITSEIEENNFRFHQKYKKNDFNNIIPFITFGWRKFQTKNESNSCDEDNSTTCDIYSNRIRFNRWNVSLPKLFLIPFRMCVSICVRTATHITVAICSLCPPTYVHRFRPHLRFYSCRSVSLSLRVQYTSKRPNSWLVVRYLSLSARAKRYCQKWNKIINRRREEERVCIPPVGHRRALGQNIYFLLFLLHEFILYSLWLSIWVSFYQKVYEMSRGFCVSATTAIITATTTTNPNVC